MTREHGAKLRSLIEQGLASDPPVTVDFGGLQIASVSFFDEAFGQLALTHGAAILQQVSFQAIDEFDNALVRDIIHSRAIEAEKRAKRRTA